MAYSTAVLMVVTKVVHMAVLMAEKKVDKSAEKWVGGLDYQKDALMVVEMAGVLADS